MTADNGAKARYNLCMAYQGSFQEWRASFYTTIEDDCIRKNPFNFALDTVLEDDTEEKIALTQE